MLTGIIQYYKSNFLKKETLKAAGRKKNHIKLKEDD